MIDGASSGLGRHTSMTDDARALTLTLSPVGRSVRMGHVPMTWNPELINAFSMVSHPVDV